MNIKRLFCFILVSIMICVPQIGQASSGYVAAFKTSYPASAARLESCLLCHATIPELNPYGGDFAANHPAGSTPDQGFAAIEALDSDADGFSNIEEISAGSLPGDIADRPDTLAGAENVTIAGVDGGSLSVPDATGSGDTTIINIFNSFYPVNQVGSGTTGSTTPQDGGGGLRQIPPADNSTVCANCHTDGRNGALPPGHEDISAYLQGSTTTTGGSSTLAGNAAVCVTCHRDGRSGATSAGHPDITELTKILFDASAGGVPQDNSAICAQCHGGSRSGTIPGDHPNLSGNLGSGGEDEEGDDEEEGAYDD